MRAFLGGAQRVAFEVASDKDARYGWIRETLVQFRYLELGKPDKRVVIRYLVKVSGYSRQQVTRLVKQYRDTGRLARRQRAVRGFRRRYTPVDIRLLAAMDERHGTPNGLTAKKLCERACEVFGHREYQRLAGISVSHLYNLRKSAGYRRCRLTVHKTRPRSVAIGERRAPRPEGRPGFLRVDTVHQGDFDDCKGVYHVNTVDEVTQMQAIASVEKISERYLIPALEPLLEAYPFTVLGFHSDNGSEFANRQVAALLEKLQDEFTVAMKDLCDRIQSECNHNPTRRREMIDNHGGQETANKLLAPGGEYWGFQNLIRLRRLDLSVECLVLQQAFQSLFSAAPLETARQRLRDNGYDPTRGEYV